MLSLVYTTRDYDLFQLAMEVIACRAPAHDDRGIFFDVKMVLTCSLEEESRKGEDSLDVTLRIF